MFRQIIGQDHAIKLFESAISNDRVAQAYLFHGNDGSGKFMAALYFGMALNCYSAGVYRPCGVCTSCRKFLNFDHQDFIYLFPTPNLKISASGEIKDTQGYKEYHNFIDNKKNSPWKNYLFSSSSEIRKESILMLQQNLDLSIHEANYRICIIENADQMNISTANAFLKTLEEPPQKTIIFLLTDRISMILPTILSRCQSVYFNPLSRLDLEAILTKRFNVDISKARYAAMIANGNFKTAIRIAEEDYSQIRTLAIQIFELACMNKELDFYNLITKSKDAFSIAVVGELLSYHASLINDLVLLQNNQELVVNIDQIDFLSTIAHNLKDIDESAYQILIQLEDFKRKLEGHVNVNLVLINLFFALRKYLFK